MIVTFCGHSEIFNKEIVKGWLVKTIRQLIEDGATQFYSGGYGDFDALVVCVIREQQKFYPNIEHVLVLAYLDQYFDKSRYDDVVYPPLEAVPRRFAILKRNEWCVEQADVVVAYVTHGWGGAATMLRYTQRKKKRVICYVK